MTTSNTIKSKPDVPASKSSKPDPILQVMKRNKELDLRTQKALGVNLVLAAAVLASIAANVFIGTRPPPEPRYIIQQNDGTMVPIIPLGSPIANKNAVTQVVTDAIAAMHAIDFKNFRSQLTEASTYFTRMGWEKYMTEMARTGTFGAMETRQLVLTSTVTRPPVIIKEYLISGVYAWDVEVPYQVNYFGAGANQSVSLLAKVTLVRVPTTTNPRGIAIAGFNAMKI